MKNAVDHCMLIRSGVDPFRTVLWLYHALSEGAPLC